MKGKTVQLCNLTTLAERRIQGGLIEAFKAVNGISCLDSTFNIISVDLD